MAKHRTGQKYYKRKGNKIKDRQKIQLNKGEGFFNTILNNANNIANTPIGKVIDDKTGLASFTRGFGESGKQYQGNALSRAAQNAGYIKKGADGKIQEYNTSKIAMGFMGASAAGRIATGGGIYKDAQGNTNVIGVPFI